MHDGEDKEVLLAHELHLNVSCAGIDDQLVQPWRDNRHLLAWSSFLIFLMDWWFSRVKRQHAVADCCFVYASSHRCHSKYILLATN